MKKLLLSLSLLVCLASYSQQNKTIVKVIADAKTKKPLENVAVYNSQNFTVSNYRGNFRFVTDADTLNFKILGYEDFATTVKSIQKIDTVFLIPKNIKLTEVTVKALSNKSFLEQSLKKLKLSLPDYKYSEKFFLRTILKKNDEIINFQDLVAKVERPKLIATQKEYTKKLKIQLLNMRKVGIVNYKSNLSFEFFSFSELFYQMILLRIDLKKVQLKRFHSPNSKLTKIVCAPVNQSDSKAVKGYYLIENDFIKQVYLEPNPDNFGIPFITKKGFKYRTIDRKLLVKFNHNSQADKYYISYAQFKAALEVINPKEQKTHYQVSYKLLTTRSFTKDRVKSNFSAKKEIFDAKVGFEEQFWKNQNQFLLSKELKTFLKRTTSLKNKKSEFKIISNL